MAELFQNMFPDSNVARKFQLGPSKVKYFANFGIKPYLKDMETISKRYSLNQSKRQVESIKKRDCYIVSFDESLNKVIQICEVDLLLRYFGPSDDRVKVNF